MSATTVIGIVGNPNCGKSTLFNQLTGSRQRVGNWPGVTVERKEGLCRLGSREITLVDLPGVYSLAARSPDEQVARDFVLSGNDARIVNIVDASNLERNLYLTVQLMEMRIPMIVVLNMMDVALERGLVIDVEELSRSLGCPVIPVVAKTRQGLDLLTQAMGHMSDEECGMVPVKPPLPEMLEQAVDDLCRELDGAGRHGTVENRWVALKLIEGDGGAPPSLWSAEVAEKAQRWRSALEQDSSDETDIMVADARYDFIGHILKDSMHLRGVASHRLTDRLDRVALHRVLGIPIFLGVLYLLFMFTINLGGAFIDFFDILGGALFVDGVRQLLTLMGSPEWLMAVVADGLGGSLQTLATFIPPIGFMFLFLSWLEDSGYMARAAFILDRLLRFIGLPGKAFIPMMVGFGCNVPAIMGTRTLEHEKDRILTIMMNPFMSCGARMPVYALFMAAFFPAGGQNVVFGLYLAGVGFAILTGLILRHTLLRGEPTPFVMELPLYHLPSLRTVVHHAWDRLKSFITKASRVLIPVIMVLSFFNSLGTDGSFGNADGAKSVLSHVGRQITPLFSPMGIEEENWPATVGLFIGVFAKEAVVGTLDALYGQMNTPDAATAAADTETWDLPGKTVEALTSIVDNLAGLGETLLDPLGVNMEEYATLDEAAAAAAVSTGTFGAMVSLFDGRVGAVAYLLFVLLYFPCAAAISAIYQETGLRWALFAGVWTTALAWTAGTVFFQVGTFSRHPGSSLAWITALAVLWVGVVLVMRRRAMAISPAPAGIIAYEKA
ncbi:MAG: Fe(2+) transporter permease subunit FeoB [Magnetococcus sp. WYHC-3]